MVLDRREWCHDVYLLILLTFNAKSQSKVYISDEREAAYSSNGYRFYHSLHSHIPYLSADHINTNLNGKTEEAELSQPAKRTSQASISIRTPFWLGISNHKDISIHNPSSTKSSSSNRILQSGNQHGSNNGRLVLEIVGVSALGTVESEGLWILGCDLGGGVWGWVGDTRGLALGAGVETVDEGEDEGGGGGEEDVAGID